MLIDYSWWYLGDHHVLLELNSVMASYKDSILTQYYLSVPDVQFALDPVLHPLGLS